MFSSFFGSATATQDTTNAATVATEVGPHVYELSNLPSESLSFFVDGCGGTADSKQISVADLMEEIAIKYGAPNFAINLGDRFYKNSYLLKPDGVLAADDPAFKTYFEEILGNPKYTILNTIVFLLALGNHDGNRHNWEKNKAKDFINIIIGKNDPDTLEMNQVIHTYLKNPAEAKKLLMESRLDLAKVIADIGRWFLPAKYYSVFAGKVQLFFLNSNTYVKDYLALSRKRVVVESTDPNNQAFWLEKEYEKAKQAGRSVIFAQHNPLISSGHRAIHGDANLYLNYDEQIEINNLIDEPVTSKDYCRMLMKIFAKQNFEANVLKAIITAHDHNLSYRNTLDNDALPLKFCQVGAGAGGGKLQSKNDKNDSDLPCFIKQNGFVKVSVNMNHPQEILFDYFTVDGIHIRFNHLSKKPIHEQCNDTTLTILREKIAEACDEYAAAHSLPHASALTSAMVTATSLWNKLTSQLVADDSGLIDQLRYYLHRPQLINLETKNPETLEGFLVTLVNMTDKLQDKSLYKTINSILTTHFPYPIDLEVVKNSSLNQHTYQAPTLL